MPKANPRLFYVTKKQQEEKSILLNIVIEIPTKYIEYIGQVKSIKVCETIIKIIEIKSKLSLYPNLSINRPVIGENIADIMKGIVINPPAIY